MKFSTGLFLLLTFLTTTSGAEESTEQQQIQISKLYYQNLFDNKYDESYELLSAKDKNSFSKEQFSRVIMLKTSVLDENRHVRIEDATVTESDETMAVVEVKAILSTASNIEPRILKSTQLLVKENNEWKIYSAHIITSMLMQAKYTCDTDSSIPVELKAQACYLYYGTK